MESHKAGFPPFPHSLEILTGFPQYHGFYGYYVFTDRQSLPQTRNQNHFRRKGLVNHVPGLKRKACPGTLTFHTIPLSLVDVDFAKEQLRLFLGHHYLHSNGQMPAYEWNLNDVNPPVHAFAVWTVYSYEKQLRERGDLAFLKFCFEKLSLNFTWWVNRQDKDENNVFAGGFLGLDNIGIFDRSSPLPTGGYLEQSDGTAWMAFFASVMLQIAIELAMEEDPHYEAMALKYFEHFLWIASAMDNLSYTGVKLWDQNDGIYYDVMRFPDGCGVRLKVRSLVGLLPLAAIRCCRPSCENGCHASSRRHNGSWNSTRTWRRF